MPVVAIIREMAPYYGVPTWFALRIAHVESGYNPNARGRAGEIGVYQLKCQTARGMGFSGNCSVLTDPRFAALILFATLNVLVLAIFVISDLSS
jgi:soluble lytic murein transglycosylase-like protein